MKLLLAAATLLIGSIMTAPGISPLTSDSELQLQTDDDPTPPVTSDSVACSLTYVGTFTCPARGFYPTSSLAAGWYLIDPYLQDTWSYSPGRWHNAFGDRLKSNRSGLVQPLGYFGELLTYARSTGTASINWIPYNGDHWVYHTGGPLYFAMNDRPGEYGDNGGSVRIKLWR